MHLCGLSSSSLPLTPSLCVSPISPPPPPPPSLSRAVADADLIQRLQEAGGLDRLRALAQCDVLQIVQVAHACLRNASEALAASASKAAREATDRKVAAEAKAKAAAASLEAARAEVALAAAEATQMAVPVAAKSPARVGAARSGGPTPSSVHEIAIDMQSPSPAELVNATCPGLRF